VKVIETEYGSFNYSKPLQIYYDLFEQIDNYDFSDLNATDVVLDLGACVGASTIKMARTAKFVVAVEPLFFDELKENIQLNHLKNVFCLPYALNHIENRFTELSFCGKTEVVKCAPMSRVLSCCPAKPTFLKTDCEGGEWDIRPEHLKGIRAVEAEIHNFNGHNPMDFVVMLQNCRFAVRYEKTAEGQLMIHARRDLNYADCV
jgi:FkbM family methyltransferase